MSEEITEIEHLGLEKTLEQEIIANAINDSRFFLDIQSYLLPQHFTNSEHGAVWKLIKGYFDRYHSVPDEFIIRQESKSKDIKLDEGYFNGNILHKEYLLEKTIKLIRYQKMKTFIMKAADNIDNVSDYETLESDLKSVLNVQPVSDLGMIYFDIDERFERIRALKQDRIRTGIPVVDRALGGGIEEQGGLAAKELVAFAAPTGVGKSYLLCIAGAHMLMKQRKNVLHYTLEMSEERTSLRYDMAALNLTTSDILENVDKTKERLVNNRNIVNKHLIIKEFPTKHATVNTFRSHIQKLKEQKGFVPDVIIIDYGDIMKSTARFSNRYEEQGAIFQELRGLAQELDIPILTATQTNRGSMDKDIVTVADLGDSFDKARIMDAIFALVQRPEDKEDGRLRIYEAKVRNGASGRMFGYELDYARAQLREIEEIDDTNE